MGLPNEVSVGGVSKVELRALLDRAYVRLNAYAERLFEDPRFQVGPEPEVIRLQIVSPGALCKLQRRADWACARWSSARISACNSFIKKKHQPRRPT